MAAINIDPILGLRIQPRVFCRNNQLVSADYQSKLGERLNQVARYRTKELFRGGGDVNTFNNDCLWRFAGHVGPMAKAIIVRALCAQSAPDAPSSSPAVALVLYDSSGNVLANQFSYGQYAYGTTFSDYPDDWVTVSVGANAAAFRNTSIRGQIYAAGQSRIISVVCYEVSQLPDTDNGYVRQQYGIGDAILDTDRSSMMTLASSLYTRGAAQSFNFSSDRDTEAPKNTGLGTVNVLDNATTTWSADSDGYTLDLRYCNRKGSTTVPMRFEAYLATDAGASLSLRLIDSSGNAVASLTANSATPQWYQTTANFRPTLEKYDLMYTSGGVQGIQCFASSLYQFAT